MEDKKSFNLKDLIGIENIEQLSSLSLNDNLLDLSNNDNKEEELTEEIIMKNREELRRRTKEKINNMRNKRLGKNTKQDSQIKALKENPLFQNLNLDNNGDVKKMIDNLASKMTTDSKQKKNIKKQMAKIMEKMKDENQSS
jgi:hypothetical protein